MLRDKWYVSNLGSNECNYRFYANDRFWYVRKRNLNAYRLYWRPLLNCLIDLYLDAERYRHRIFCKLPRSWYQFAKFALGRPRLKSGFHPVRQRQQLKRYRAKSRRSFAVQYRK